MGILRIKEAVLESVLAVYPLHKYERVNRYTFNRRSNNFSM